MADNRGFLSWSHKYFKKCEIMDTVLGVFYFYLLYLIILIFYIIVAIICDV